MNRGGGGPRAGEMQGVVMGKVVDNVDPEEYGRIKVKLVTTHNEAETFWAWQLAPMTGKERGFYTLPEVDDTVLVAFIQGSQDNAVILGALWNGKDIPPQEAKDALPGPAKTDTGATYSTEQFTDGSKTIEGNDRRLWKSRSGHLYVFDDTEGAETVQIWDKDHILSIAFDSTKKLITIANTEGDIHIRAKENLFLETTNGDVKIRSGKNMLLEAQTDIDQETKSGKWTAKTATNASLTSTGTTDVKASMDASFKSDTNATFEGSVQATVKGGATTSVSATGMTEVKGAIIKIN
jgi:phage baseplate assembly protein gpV